MKDHIRLLKNIPKTIETEGVDVLLCRAITKLLCNNVIGYRVANTPLNQFYVNWVVSLHRTQNRILASLNENITIVDPAELFWVNPMEITYISRRVPNRFGLVVSEQLNTGKRFESLPIVKALKKRFDKGLSWEETGYRQVVENSPTERIYPDRYNNLDALADAIQREGYRSQRDLLSKNTKKTYSSNNDGRNPIFNEVTINIGRNGELLWHDRGRHRLALAKILDVNKIPVLVQARHSKYIKHSGLRSLDC